MSAFRSLRQLSVATSRGVALRSVPATRLRLPTLGRISVPATRAFSVSARSLAEGSSDVVLSQKLAEELQYEKSATVETTQPEFLKSFAEEGIWKVDDVYGKDEVTFSRTFGKESIEFTFSITDIHIRDEAATFEGEEEEEEVPEEDRPIQSYAIRVPITITKTNAPGCMTIETVCQEGSFMIETVAFFPDAKVGTEATPDAEWKRKDAYLGPQFETLDVSLQEEFEKYLSERGIGESLALFIPEYAEFKEQKEYVNWLQSVKKFVEL